MKFSERESMLNEIKIVKDSITRLENQVKSMSVDMKVYLIKYKPYKAQIPCSRCLDNGEINSSCNQCSGKGVHSKTKHKWVVDKRGITIDKITKEKGATLYWISMSEFYSSDEELIYESIEDAEYECIFRNGELQ